MNECLRCKRDYNDGIFDEDTETEICQKCFTESSLCSQGVQSDIVEIHIEKRWRDELGK